MTEFEYLEISYEYGQAAAGFAPGLLRNLLSRVGRRAAPKIPDIVLKLKRDWSTADKYYANAESEKWLGSFWDVDSPFRPLFDRLDHDHIIELACGHGRHSWQMREWPNRKTLVDFVEANIAFCRRRFEGYDDVSFVVNNGRDLSGIESESATSLFCYDAMVHFHHTLVGPYLIDSARVLVRGGMALLHHSNYAKNPDGDYRENPHARAFMSPDLFARYATAAGLVVVEQRVVSWDADKDLDAITLLRKP